MSSSLGVGEPIPCYLQLFDYANDKFPRAVVRNGAGVELEGSPVDLELVADGLYRNVDLNMPDTAQVSVQYFTYTDAGHTVLDQSYSGTADVFTRQSGGGSSATPVSSNIVGVIDGEGCKQTGVQDTLVKGSGRVLAIRLVSQFPNGEPFNLTGFTKIEAKFLNEDRTVLTLSTDDDEITVTLAAAGKLTVAITKEQSALLMPGSPIPFTMVVTMPLGPVALNFPYQLQILDEAVL